MFKRLTEVDLPASLKSLIPPNVTRGLTAIAFAGMAITLRYALQQVDAGVAPFALIFPAVLAATMLSGWLAGALTLAISELAVWRLFLPDPPGPALLSLRDALELALFTASGAALIFLTEAFVQDSRAAAKRRTLEVRQAQLDSERQLRIAQEMNHRVKNTLAIVQSLASQSFHGGRAEPAAQADFSQRLRALAGAHELLIEKGRQSFPLREVISRAIAPFEAGDGGRIRLAGPDLPVATRKAVPLTMALHELGTNAVKYGALSVARGEVWIRWSESVEAGRPMLRLDWQESGGPAVKAPTRRGFGSKLLEHALAQELNAEISLEFAVAGLKCTIVAPIAGLTDLAA